MARHRTLVLLPAGSSLPLRARNTSRHPLIPPIFPLHDSAPRPLARGGAEPSGETTMPRLSQFTNTPKKLAYLDVDDVTHESELALHIITGGDQVHWIPKSLIQRGTEIETVGDTGLLILPAWFTDKECIPL